MRTKFLVFAVLVFALILSACASKVKEDQSPIQFEAPDISLGTNTDPLLEKYSTEGPDLLINDQKIKSDNCPPTGRIVEGEFTGQDCNGGELTEKVTYSPLVGEYFETAKALYICYKQEVEGTSYKCYAYKGVTLNGGIPSIK